MIRWRFIMIAISCLFLASCMSMPRPGDYGTPGDIQDVQVIIAPLKKGKQSKPLPHHKWPLFNYKIGIFNFLAENESVGERLATMAHQHLLNLQRFRTIGMINEPPPLGAGPGKLALAVERGRKLGYDLVLIGEALDIFSGLTSGPSRVGLRIRIIDTKKASTVWLIVGRRAVKPRPMQDYIVYMRPEKPAPDAMSLAHYLLLSMLERL